MSVSVYEHIRWFRLLGLDQGIYYIILWVKIVFVSTGVDFLNLHYSFFYLLVKKVQLPQRNVQNVCTVNEREEKNKSIFVLTI